MTWSIAAGVLCGVLLHTFVEYVSHRWLAHGRGQPVARGHRRHHARPSYIAHVGIFVAPPAVALIGTGLWVLFGPAFAVATIASGVVTALLAEVAHHRMHHGGLPGRWGRALVRLHLHHHYGDTRTNLGVITLLWDRVFGTYAPAPQVRVPRRQAEAMPWMFPDGVHAAAPWDAHFELATGRGGAPVQTPGD